MLWLALPLAVSAVVLLTNCTATRAPVTFWAASLNCVGRFAEGIAAGRRWRCGPGAGRNPGPPARAAQTTRGRSSHAGGADRPSCHATGRDQASWSGKIQGYQNEYRRSVAMAERRPASVFPRPSEVFRERRWADPPKRAIAKRKLTRAGVNAVNHRILFDEGLLWRKPVRPRSARG